MEAVLLVADVLDCSTGDLLDQLPGDGIRAAHFACEHDEIGRAQGLDCDPRMRIGSQIGIDNGIGDAVADLVRMALGDGFPREEAAACGTLSDIPEWGRST